jgi:hypothetical protein
MSNIDVLILVLGLFLCMGSSTLRIVAPNEGEPTDGEFQAAAKAFEKVGGRFDKYTYPDSKLTVYTLHMRPKTSDEDLKKLPSISFAFGLVLADTKVTNAGLKEIAKLKNLDRLNLNNTKITDAGLKEIANLLGLATLHLAHTQVTDAGLKEIAPLKNLTNIDLSFTNVTDIGVSEIATFNKLTILNIYPWRTGAPARRLLRR